MQSHKLTGESSPYYDFGYQTRYPFQWHGGAGGVPSGHRSAVRRELGAVDLEESGANSAYTMNYPAFGDWPALRPAGPEPLDPGEALGLFDNLSDNEKRLALVGVVGAAAYWFFVLRKPKKRRRRRR